MTLTTLGPYIVLQSHNVACGRRSALTIVVTDPWDLIQPAVAVLRRAGVEVEVLPAGLSSPEVADRAADAEVLLVGITPVRADSIARLRGTGLIVRCGVGYDIVDVPAATARGIWVANVPDYCIDEVADHTLLLILAVARRLRSFQEIWAQDGRWAKLDYPEVHRLAGRTLGLIGFGRIASNVADRARAFGLRVIVADPRFEPGQTLAGDIDVVGLPRLLEEGDIISLHCPLIPETRGLLGDDAFVRMKLGALIVNTARGELIQLAALERALDSGRLAAAGLDVVEGEPDPQGSRGLLGRANVIVTPHVGWYSQEALRDLGEGAAGAVLRYLDGGRPASLINPEARMERSPGASRPVSGAARV